MLLIRFLRCFWLLRSFEVVSLNKELYKQKEVTSIHDQCRRIVVLRQKTFLVVLGSQDESKDRRDDTDHHL